MWRSRLCFLALLAGLGVVIGFQVQQGRRISRTDSRLNARFQQLQARLDELRLDAFHSMVDRLAEGASTDQEKCIRITRHFATQMRVNLRDDEGRDVLGCWAVRSGLCGARTLLSITALRRLGIEAKVWNIYDYPFGHSCFVANYDGAWHFYDPLLGVYFRGEGGQVLDWEQVAAAPAKAVAGMVMCKDSPDSDGARFVRSYYAPERIAGVRNAGVKRGGRVFDIPAYLPLPQPGQAEWIGTCDGSGADLLTSGQSSRSRCFYLDTLGNWYDNFRYEFHFPEDRPVRLTFHFRKQSNGPSRLMASSPTGLIANGAEGPVCEHADGGGQWSIVYMPKGETGAKGTGGVIVVGLSSWEEPSYALLDAISVTALASP
jgi:hypothetical protein